MKRIILALACLALSACGGVKKPDEAGNASGKVLEGSISDSMIDLDQSRAEAPLAGPGSGVPAGANEAARDLLAKPRAAGADDAGATATDAPEDQPTTAPVVHDKSAEKPAESAAPPVKPTVKPPARPAASTPAKPKAKPAFRKPTDDGA